MTLLLRCLAIAIAWICFSTNSSYARTIRLLDFDGTIVDDQGEFSTWRTYWVLVRVDHMHTMMQPNPVDVGAPSLLRISYKEYLKYARFLGRDGLFNFLETVPLDEDPVMIGRKRDFVPGFYQVDEKLTFKYYRRAVGKTKSYLVRDYINAKERTRLMNIREEGKNYDWRGPAFKIFRAGMSNPRTVGDTKVFSSRWHSNEEYQTFLDLLLQDGEIAFSEGLNHQGKTKISKFYSLSAPEARLYARFQEGLAARKAQLVHDEAVALLNAPKIDNEPFDTLIVADDEPRYIEKIAITLEELSSSPGFKHRIKFVLVNTGSDADVAWARHRYRYAVIENGRGRPATVEEVLLWETPDPSFKSDPQNVNCKSLFEAPMEVGTK